MTSQQDPQDLSASKAEVNIAIDNNIGGFTAGIINGDVNVSVDYQPKTIASKLGANPYKALEAFEVGDAQRFFGRRQETQVLLRKLRELYTRPNKVRVLPVYGPSGSGKSSLIRAGLVATLIKRGRKTGKTLRITGLVPGVMPVSSLARRLMQWQPAADAETVKTWVATLSQPNEQGQYDGLHRLISALPDVSAAPLMILVDQFEEVFTQPARSQGAITEQSIFIQNLLFAAASPTTRVLVVLTFRSDFLRETQDYPVLNQLCTEQGYLVPMLTREGLREAIMKPAQMAGYDLELDTVQQLVNETHGHEGALPLLQFVLAQIWSNLRLNITPALTLERLGGVGGALTHRAQEIYERCSDQEKAIVRRVFLELIQLGEGTQDTRRRMSLENLVAHDEDRQQVRQVIEQFADEETRLITV